MKLRTLFLYSTAMLLLVSCAKEDGQEAAGYGAINVQLSTDFQAIPVTRATTASSSRLGTSRVTSPHCGPYSPRRWISCKTPVGSTT